MSAQRFQIPDIEIGTLGPMNFNKLSFLIFGRRDYFVPIDRVRLAWVIKHMLRPNHSFVVQARARGVSLERIASLVGVTRERVRQIEAQAFRQLRHPHRTRKYRIPDVYIEQDFRVALIEPIGGRFPIPIFKCKNCAFIENTAASNYWTAVRFDKTDPLCSQCDPAIGKWHGLFPRTPATGYKLGNDGFLYEPELLAAGSFDNLIKVGLKIIGDA